MSWRNDFMGDKMWCEGQVSPGGVPYEALRRFADEFLGPNRSLEDLEPRERSVLIAEIEADMLGLDERLQIVPHNETHTY